MTPTSFIPEEQPHAGDGEALSTEEIQKSNDRTSGDLEIRLTPDRRGWGIYALRSFVPGAVVMRARCVADLPHRTKHSVQVDWDRHVLWDLPAVLVNHACSGNDGANVGIRWNRNNGNSHDKDLSYEFCALRSIQAGDEVLWDYETAEYEMGDFECRCGASRCRRQLRGFQWHQEDVLRAYGGKHVAPYLLPEEGEGQGRSATPPSVVVVDGLV